MSRRAWAGLFGLCVLIAVAVAAVRRVPAMLERAMAERGVRVRVASAGLGLDGALTLSGLEAESAAWRLSAEELRLRPVYRALLRRRLEVASFTLRDGFVDAAGLRTRLERARGRRDADAWVLEDSTFSTRNVRWFAAGTYAAGVAAMEATLEGAEGRVRLRYPGPKSLLDWDLAASSASLRVSSQGTLDLSKTPAWLDAALDAAGEDLSARFAAKGPLDDPRWSLDARAGELSRDGVYLASATARGSGTLHDAAFNFKARRAAARGIGFESVSLSVTGSTTTHRISASGLSGRRLSLRGTGGWTAGRWSGALERVVLQGSSIGLRAPAKVAYSSAGFTLSGVDVVSRGGRVQGRLALAPDGAFKLRAVLSGGRAEVWSESGLAPAGFEGAVSGSLDLKGSSAAPRGTFSLEVASAAWNGAPLGALSARGESDGVVLKVPELVWRSPRGPVRASFTAPLAWGPAGPDFEFTIDSALEAFDFEAEDASVAVSSLSLVGTLSGRRGGGRIESTGELRLSAARLTFETWGLDLAQPQAEIEGQGDGIVVRGIRAVRPPEARLERLARRMNVLNPKRWLERLKAKNAAPAGPLLSGEGGFDAAGPRLRVKLVDAPFATPGGLAGRAGADITLSGSWAKPLWSGRIAVAQGSVDLDQRAKNREERRRGPGPTALDLRVVTENEFFIRDAATRVEARAELRILKDPYAQVRLFGRILSENGTYVFAGRNFRIEDARIEFHGAMPPDPALDIHASYTDEATRTKISIHMRGTRSAPELLLSSQPPLEERDILSILLIGKPTFELDERRDSHEYKELTRDAAARLVSDYLVQTVNRRLLRRLNLDVLSVRAKGAQEAELAVGRRFGRDLFVEYGASLGGEGGNRVDTRYRLSPRWSVESRSTSEGKHLVDVLFDFALR